MAGHEFGQHRIVRRRRARHAARLVEDPPRDAAVARPHGPAGAVAQVGEGELGLVRSGQAIGGADALQIVLHSAVARQNKVIAVVDGHAELGVEIGAAAAAGLGGGLGQDHPLAAGGQDGGGRQPGQPGAHHMDGHGISP